MTDATTVAGGEINFPGSARLFPKYFAPRI